MSLLPDFLDFINYNILKVICRRAPGSSFDGRCFHFCRSMGMKDLHRLPGGGGGALLRFPETSTCGAFANGGGAGFPSVPAPPPLRNGGGAGAFWWPFL